MTSTGTAIFEIYGIYIYFFRFGNIYIYIFFVLLLFIHGEQQYNILFYLLYISNCSYFFDI